MFCVFINKYTDPSGNNVYKLDIIKIEFEKKKYVN